MAYASNNLEKFYHGFPTPGPQDPTTDQVMAHVFFASEETWKKSREVVKFDYIVIGSGFCSYAFVERIISKAREEGVSEVDFPKILIVERGSFFLPEHFQNLPLAFKFATPDQKYMNETFPWTLAAGPATSDPEKGFEKNGGASWMHGMVPFFGGRSTLWSGWTPRPRIDLDELVGWPVELTNMMTEKFFEGAEQLLGAVDADAIGNPEIPKKFHIYSDMQKALQRKLGEAIGSQDRHGKCTPSVIPNATRAFGAPMAVADSEDPLISFEKYSVVGPYLELLHNEKRHVTCALDCTVSRIIQQNNVPTALETSRGILPLSKNTKIILAVGCMPAATLLLNSFPKEVIPNVGNKFAAHIITAITAKVPFAVYKELKDLNVFELAAVYLAGIVDTKRPDGTVRKLSYHAQISILRVENASEEYPKVRAQALRYMPDVVATASDQAMLSSNGDVVFVLALLGEMDVENRNNNFKLLDPNAKDKTSNCILDYTVGSTDQQLWDAMDQAGVDIVEKVFAHSATEGRDFPVEYWQVDNPVTGDGHWSSNTPDAKKVFRVPGMVHESSVVSAGPEHEGHACDYKFRPYGTHNVYVTGSGLWPTGCSWNPTMTMCAFAQTLADNLHAEKKKCNEAKAFHQQQQDVEHSDHDDSDHERHP